MIAVFWPIYESHPINEYYFTDKALCWIYDYFSGTLDLLEFLFYVYEDKNLKKSKSTDVGNFDNDIMILLMLKMRGEQEEQTDSSVKSPTGCYIHITKTITPFPSQHYVQCYYFINIFPSYIPFRNWVLIKFNIFVGHYPGRCECTSKSYRLINAYYQSSHIFTLLFFNLEES